MVTARIESDKYSEIVAARNKPEAAAMPYLQRNVSFDTAFPRVTSEI